MQYLTRALSLIALLVLAAIVLACGDDDGNGHVCAGRDDGLYEDTLCINGSGEQSAGAFSVTGAFDVEVVGGNVASGNTTIRVYQIVTGDDGNSISLVGTTGPKALVPGIVVRPGDAVDVNFDFGPGEFYLIISTDESNDWTAIISPVDSI